MKASPPPPSYSVAMEQNQITPTADTVEPPSYQEMTTETDEIQPNISAPTITTTTPQNATRGS